MSRKDDDEPHVPPERPPAYPFEEALEKAYAPEVTPEPAQWAEDAPNQGALVDASVDSATQTTGGSVIGEPTATSALAQACASEIPPESLEKRLSKLPPWQGRYVLALMELGGIMGLACARCSVSRQSVQKAQEASTAFAEACGEAVEHSTDVVEAAVFRGATVGDLQPIYQGQILVGYKRVRSPKDAENLLRIRGRLKDEQEINVKTTSKVTIQGQVEIARGVDELAARLFGHVVEGEVLPENGIEIGQKELE